MDQLDRLTVDCLLPELAADIGSELHDSNHFAKFVTKLNTNLHLIFDILQEIKEPGLLSQLSRRNLVLLFSEQTASHAEYQTDQKILLQSIQARLAQAKEWLVQDEQLRQNVLDWYKSRVTTAKWKRNMGASHGLARFCEIISPISSIQIDIKDGLFLLSAGTLMMEHFDHVYKELGLDIWLFLLRSTSTYDLSATNLQDPIFDLCLRNVSNVKSLHINRQLWTCLIFCLKLKPACNQAVPNKWNHRDDVCSAILNRIAFESDWQIRFYLLQCFPEVFAPAHFIQLTRLPKNESINSIDLYHLREYSKEHICLVACRWTKKLSNILSYHVSCCFGLSSDVALHLRVVHICYLICMFGMPLRLIGYQMQEFINIIPTHLLQLVQHNKGDPLIRREVLDIFQSLIMHLSNQTGLDEEASSFFVERSKTLCTINEALIKLK